ncbi:MAG: class I SAM-dependent methyltransferase [Streptococcus sp.]|nr:class I SAM-dependent methyltransferase [Streptococcus sp.]
MSQMYFESNPNSQHDIHELSVELLGEHFQFLTDAGVFSKRMIDYGSQVLLNAISVESGEKILDLGCGYGPIGITLGKVFQADVTMVDVNSRALELAQKNALKNGVEAKIFESFCYDAISMTYDHIISNPPIRAGKKVVHKILEESVNYLTSKGKLTIVIQKKQGAPSAKVKMESLFGNCTVLKKDKGYYILQSEK